LTRSRKWPSRIEISLLLFVCLFVITGHLAWAEEEEPAQPKERYSVELGVFKTVPAMADLYLQIPPRLQKDALVCHTGINYILRCGAVTKKDMIDPIFKELNELGLRPIVVKGDLTNCSPAQSFFKSYGKRAPGNIQKSTNRKTKKPPAYADLMDPALRHYLAQSQISVLPEVTTKVYLSNRDVNRITCIGRPIKDIVYSKEKGITVKTEGSNAFIKFLISKNPMTGELEYSSVPSEFYVVCGKDTVYTLIATPKNIPAQAIELVSREKDIKKNLSIFDGLSFERKVVKLVKVTYRDTIPDTFTVQHVNKKFNLFRYIDVVLKRIIIADGEGLELKEFLLRLKDSSPELQKEVTEKFFLLPELTRNPVGISLDHMILKKGRPSRLFIVERHVD